MSFGQEDRESELSVDVEEEEVDDTFMRRDTIRGQKEKEKEKEKQQQKEKAFNPNIENNPEIEEQSQNQKTKKQ